MSELLLNPQNFYIDEEIDSKKYIHCQKLIEKWTKQLENEMLEAFINFYYDKMYQQWGPNDKQKFQEYWPKINSPIDLIQFIGTNVTLYALEDAVYSKSETTSLYQSDNVPICVIFVLNCPWDEEHGWSAVFIDEKFVKVDSDIVNCVWLD